MSTVLCDHALHDWTAESRSGFSLPAPLYLSPESFAVDLDVIFGRHWICIGVEADVPERGAIMTVDIGPRSVAIVRGSDNIIRAFANVCRHRGSRICPVGRSQAARLVCPYHQWTYALDGLLVHASHMGADFDASGFTLQALPLRTLGGLLFLCLSEDAPDDFDDMARALALRLAPFDLSRAKIAHEEDLIEAGNWKLTIENNRECYHCEATHPELGTSFIAADFFRYPSEEVEDEFADERTALMRHWESLGLVNDAAERQLDCATPFRTERLMIAGKGESQTIDTGVASRKLLGSITEPRLGDLHFWTFNSWHHFMSDHAVCIYVVPLAPDRTLVRTKWLVAADAEPGIDYDVERLTEVWRATNRQDAALVERTHQGVADPAYRPGPYSPHAETYVSNFAAWYLERLRAHGI